MSLTPQIIRPRALGAGQRGNSLLILKNREAEADQTPEQQNSQASGGGSNMGSPSSTDNDLSIDAGVPPDGGGPASPGGDFRPNLPEGIRKSLRAFVSSFDELLVKYQNRWVACDESGFRDVGDDWAGVYARCLKRGMKPDEFVVDYMTPGGLDDLDLTSLSDPV